MFDEIRCDAPLPDGQAAKGVWFQSKSFPDCCMRRYTITLEGRLMDSVGNDLEPEGYLTFYTDSHNPDADNGARHWREYRARFRDGQLQYIERVTPDQPERRYHGLASFRWFDSPGYMFGDPDEAAHGNHDGLDRASSHTAAGVHIIRRVTRTR